MTDRGEKLTEFSAPYFEEAGLSHSAEGHDLQAHSTLSYIHTSLVTSSFKISLLKPETVLHTHNPSTWMLRQEDHWKFKAGLQCKTLSQE